MVRSRYWYCVDHALVTIPELSRKQMIDPVTLAVLKGQLEHIVGEMDAILFRNAFNPIIVNAHGASSGILRRRS